MYLNFFQKKDFENDKEYFRERLNLFSNDFAKSAEESVGLNLRNHILQQMFIKNETIFSLAREDKILLDSS